MWAPVALQNKVLQVAMCVGHMLLSERRALPGVIFGSRPDIFRSQQMWV